MEERNKDMCVIGVCKEVNKAFALGYTQGDGRITIERKMTLQKIANYYFISRMLLRKQNAP